MGIEGLRPQNLQNPFGASGANKAQSPQQTQGLQSMQALKGPQSSEATKATSPFQTGAASGAAGAQGIDFGKIAQIGQPRGVESAQALGPAQATERPVDLNNNGAQPGGYACCGAGGQFGKVGSKFMASA